MSPQEKKPPSKLTPKNIATVSVAGGVSGALEICFTYPFEFAKTQVQLDPKRYKGKSFWVCWKDSVREFGGFPKGLSGIYRGMLPLILFGIPRNASRFTAFELANQNMKEHTSIGMIPRTMIAGFVGGFSEAVLVTTVQETMKVRLIHDKLSPTPRFKNTFHGISTILREHGFSGVYKGLTPTILKQGSNQMIRFPVYCYLKVLLVGNLEDDFSKNGPIVGNLQAMLVGGLAGAASVVGNTPIDVIKTKMQGFQADMYKSSWDCIQKTWAEEGMVGFYKGMGARMGRVSADVALTFFFVEKVKLIIKKLFD